MSVNFVRLCFIELNKLQYNSVKFTFREAYNTEKVLVCSIRQTPYYFIFGDPSVFLFFSLLQVFEHFPRYAMLACM